MFEGLKMQHWRWSLRDNGVLHLIFDRAEADTNTLSRSVMAEIGQWLERISIEPPAGLVIRSGKANGFIAGADVSEFRDVFESAQVLEGLLQGQRLFQQLATLPCPSVAAIHGFCMGGGTELALACGQRIAVDDNKTRIGLPEVLLGLHPGWGGMVRLPALIGAPAALDMILSGRGLSAAAARRKGLVDRIVSSDALISTAEEMVLKRAPRSRAPLYLRLTNRFPARQILAPTIRKRVRARVNPKHYPAPFAAIDIWRKYGGNPRKLARAEVRSFARLAETDTARNLIRVFFLREAMRKLGAVNDATIERVHIIGAGTMGGDIAAWCALHGMTVTLQDRDEALVKPALARAQTLFQRKLKKPARVSEATDRLQMDVDGAGIAHADLVIEAIFENLEAKHALLRDLEPRMRADAVLATNTSSIPLQDLRTVLTRPESFVGLHFFNPVAKMPLLEIVRHDRLDAQTLQRAAGFARAIDKLPVPVAGTPGFLVNRILTPYLLEAVTLYCEGHPGRVIDKAAMAFGMPMGPIELADQIGLDICASVAEVLGAHFGIAIPTGLGEMLAAGKRGKKDGEGFYRYEQGKAIKPPVADGYQAPEDLTDRLIMSLLNEAIACLREGVVESPDMLDAGVIFGTGFAPFRGGPWQYIQDTGTTALRQKLIDLSERHGQRFKPDPGWTST